MMTKIITIGTLILAIVLCIGYLFLFNVRTSQVYVNTGKLYSEFTMSKEFKKELELEMKSRKHSLDSLYKRIQDHSTHLNLEGINTSKVEIKELNNLRNTYLAQQEKVETEYQQLVQENDNKIWNQINQYVKDYGEKSNYDFILGANGDGNIMYSKSGKDITNEIIDYCNKSYEGKIN